jgi:hypothetical protein
MNVSQKELPYGFFTPVSDTNQTHKPMQDYYTRTFHSYFHLFSLIITLDY